MVKIIKSIFQGATAMAASTDPQEAAERQVPHVGAKSPEFSANASKMSSENDSNLKEIHSSFVQGNVCGAQTIKTTVKSTEEQKEDQEEFGGLVQAPQRRPLPWSRCFPYVADFLTQTEATQCQWISRSFYDRLVPNYFLRQRPLILGNGALLYQQWGGDEIGPSKREPFKLYSNFARDKTFILTKGSKKTDEKRQEEYAAAFNSLTMNVAGFLMTLRDLPQMVSVYPAVQKACLALKGSEPLTLKDPRAALFLALRLDQELQEAKHPIAGCFHAGLQNLFGSISQTMSMNKMFRTLFFNETRPNRPIDHGVWDCCGALCDEKNADVSIALLTKALDEYLAPASRDQALVKPFASDCFPFSKFYEGRGMNNFDLEFEDRSDRRECVDVAEPLLELVLGTARPQNLADLKPLLPLISAHYLRM